MSFLFFFDYLLTSAGVRQLELHFNIRRKFFLVGCFIPLLVILRYVNHTFLNDNLSLTAITSTNIFLLQLIAFAQWLEEILDKSSKKGCVNLLMFLCFLV